MLDETQRQARELIIADIDKIIEKYNKKADKEKAKRDNAFITYKGVEYYTENDLQEGYACDVFNSATYDRLLERLNKARGKVDKNEFTPTECLIIELNSIKNNLFLEIKIDAQERKNQELKDKRVRELTDQGYSYREIQTIISNEELMRFE